MNVSSRRNVDIRSRRGNALSTANFVPFVVYDTVLFGWSPLETLPVR